MQVKRKKTTHNLKSTPMKIKNLLTTLTLTATLLVFGQASFGQALLVENFDYTAGTTLLSNGWTEQGGPTTTNALTIATGNLTYTNYASSNIGNYLPVASSGQDAYKAFTTQNSGSVYTAFLLNISAANTTGDYFFSYEPVGGNTSYTARLFAKKDASNNIAFGVSKATETAVYSSFDYALNTTYLLVVKYEIISGANNDIISVFVNPTLGGAEPTATITTTGGTANDAASIGAILVRQGTASNAATFTIDGIRVATTWADAVAPAGADTEAPVATFTPTNGATDIAITAAPTISFNEPIRNTDNSEITDANVGSVVTLKEKVSGDAVASTITINAEKKLITITPNADLKNSMEYEISLSPVEDANDNATTLATSTFTTIASTTPTITLTAPNGDEKFYAGAQATITWTSTNIDAAETITIEVAPNGTTYEFLATSTNDGTETVTIPANAAYATTYKIRVSYSTASDESNAAFTVIATTDNLAALRALPVNSLVKYTGKATVTFPTSYRNQKYIQDATAAILIDDPTTAPGYITDSYAIGDGISNIEGMISVYANLIQLVPKTTTGEKVTGNPTITPEVRTIASLTAADQCKLVKIENMSLSATGNFAARTNYDVVGQANTAFVLRSAPDGADYIGTAIPVYPFDVISVVGQYNAVMQITPRSLADFDVHVPVYTVTFTVTRNSAAIEGASIAINSQTLTTNASGVATIDLPSGTYSYTVTKDGYNTNNGSVVVADAAKAVNVTMTLTSVGTNSISKLNAYPNPFSNEIRFDGAEIARVTITSIIGQVVMDKVVAGENLVETQSLSKGIYLVKFTNVKGESVLRKLIKE